MHNDNTKEELKYVQSLIDLEMGKKLINVLSKYKFFDLCRAVFCFNSWRYTRPHLQFYLTLNYVLCNIDQNGKCQIQTYSEFEKFIDEISPYYDGTFDDEIIPDFGEIKIPFNNVNYSVIVGTGYDLFFPFLVSVEALSNALNITVEIEQVLSYVDNVCKVYGFIEDYCSDKYDAKKIVIPTEEYFNNCVSNYNIVDIESNDFLLNLSFDAEKGIEKTHFVQSNDKFLPLFNPSMIIDAFDILCDKNKFPKSEMEKASNIVVYDSIVKNFDNNPDSGNILFDAFVVKDLDKKTVYKEVPFNFVVLHNNSALLLLNQERCKGQGFGKNIDEIKRLIDAQTIKILEPLSDGKCRLYDLSDIENIEIIVYDNSIQIPAMTNLFPKTNLICFNLYDLVSVIYEANNIEDVINFCKYIKEKQGNVLMSLMCSGFSGIFYAWMKRDEEIVQGAYDNCNIMTDVYMLEWDIFEKYMDLNRWYPIKKFNEMFYNPFAWIVEEEKLGFRRLISNNVWGFGGSFRKIKDSYVFIAFNLNFENEDEEWNKRNEAIILIEELIERNILELEDALIKSNVFNYEGIQLTYMPKHYAEKIDKDGFLKSNRKYVFSDMSILNDKILIRFAVNEDNLFSDILNAKDRNVECEFMNELFAPLKTQIDIKYEYIDKFLKDTMHLKKNIEAMSIEPDYIFSNKNLGLWPSEKIFVKVRKFIAIKCKDAGIKTNVYKSAETTNVIRNIQKHIIPMFENEISKYNQNDLHKYLISIISFYLHKKRIEMKRYNIKDSKILTDNAKSHTAEHVIKVREECKDHIRDLYYLVDTNLAVNRDGNTTEAIKSDNIEFLIAFSHILMNLQDCADNAHYNLFGASINVEDDFTIETNFSDDFMKMVDSRNIRIYENIDYKPSLPNDNEMFNKSLQAFYKDTGVHLKCIIQMCQYLSREFSAVFKEQSIPDVYVIKKQDLISDYESILIDQSDETKLNHLNALEYLIIDKSKIKQINGSINDFVPVWEREKRDNRFEVKPIVEDGEYLIFAPSIMYELSQLWLNGTFEFYPPYEIGLSNYRKQLDKWKSLCETQMEQDLFNLFNSYGYKTYKNIFLHKLDKKFGYPQDLGDYDVLAFDLDRKTIWNIESKFLGKVGSLKEYYNHQSSFFNNDKKDEKFYNRIKYLSEHKCEILKSFGIENGSDFTIKDFMVTNKVFVADVKEISFAILTYNELEKMLVFINESI